MGGGWAKQGSGVPLSERVRPGAPADPEAAHRSQECPARHCWVSDALDRHGVQRPGLLVEWRQAEAGWEGRVAYLAQLRPDAWQLVEEWVPAAWLTPG
ncbi:hypothetical protein [Nocardioides sp. cx-173]|uniref:hypothetical protein n=1 Tax=Nocardioides sp. cx-173 TaxID=2898796 RepID=UPI001E329863|nr:hypothetical protein [Nocardioides sp. cx-173]MCD4525113.1 hypothetical protein [Nocardioides sp. cx-173]UGB40184.1 hypothetical protein LQ940_12360 [Nocardioides sp. cx-173]